MSLRPSGAEWMPERTGYIASGALHVLIVLLFLVGLPNFFKRDLPQDMPLVVQLVKLAPETRATQIAKTPPKPDAKPEVVDDTPPPPKPVPPKPEPPKPEPPKPPPTPAPAPPEPTPPPPEPKPTPPPPTPPPPVPPPPPAPPPQEAKVEPKLQPPAPQPPPPKPAPPKPKPDDANFDSLLKNLAKNDPKRNEPPDPKAKPSPPPPRSSSQPVAPLGAALTTSEKDMVLAQLAQCWNIPAGARDAQNLTPEFRVSMNADATVRSVDLINKERLGEPLFQAAADSARRALFNPKCTPLKLPLDKYNDWQTFTITFNPKDFG